jgi:hypothetical protein
MREMENVAEDRKKGRRSIVHGQRQGGQKFPARNCNILKKAGVIHPKSNKKLKRTTMDADLRDVLMPVTILGTLGAAIVLFTRTVSDYILKKKMIDKGYVNEDTQAIFKRSTEENRYTSLKWGLIILFGGLSLIIMEYIDYENTSPLPYGLFAVFVSLGFLIYYFMVKKELNK